MTQNNDGCACANGSTHERCSTRRSMYEPADQHESHVRPSIPRVTSHQLMPRESVSRSRLSQWCSGVADASREIVVLQAAILAPSSCHCFEPCENALASWSGLSAMYVRHGGASRLALVPQLQLCVTDIYGLILWIRICRKSNLRLKLRLAGLSFKKG